MRTSQDYGRPVFWTSNKRPPPRLLNPCETLRPHSFDPQISAEEPEIRKIPSPDDSGDVKLSGMETITREVGELRDNERSAAELLLGHRLRGNERLILQVLDLDVAQPAGQDSRPAQTLPDWCNVYEGLTDEEVERIDQSITRGKLTRAVE